MIQEAIAIVLLIVCLIAVAMGIVGFRRLKTTPPLLISIGFALFAVYHLLSALQMGRTLWWLMILLILAAYILIIVALYVLMDKKKDKM